jgi:hypothetical protein
MAAIFDYVPHPHIERRRAEGPPTIAAAREKIHGQGPIARLNAAVGLRITLIVGTMWCAYAFAVIALFGVPAALNGPKEFVAWVSSQFLQLVLLPIIIVGQNIQGAAADARSEATFNDAAAVLEEAKQIQAHLAAQDAELQKILEAARTLGAQR